jgi:hypothetical protein
MMSQQQAGSIGEARVKRCYPRWANFMIEKFFNFFVAKLFAAIQNMR